MRIFLAIDLPLNIKNDIQGLEDKLKGYSRRMRLTPVKNLHITVKFLGEQPDYALNKIRDIATDVFSSIKPFEICLKKTGMFGGIRNPKILWLGEENSDFIDMVNRVNSELNIFRQEKNKPVCHLTIGRIKGMNANDAIDILNICREFNRKKPLCFKVFNVYLYKSVLLRSGAIYEKIDTFKMKEIVDG